MSPKEIAQKASQAMYDADVASKSLGITIDEIGPGYAKLSMPVRDDMLNGLKICHGGIMFTLADSTFAFACNSYNQSTVAASCEISFLEAVPGGSVLTAIAEEKHKRGRSGIYDVTVVDQDGRTVALFRGKSRTVKGEVVPGLTSEEESK
jgi:acyl-CoA thioesterase